MFGLCYVFSVVVFVCLGKVFIIIYLNLGSHRICLFKPCLVVSRGLFFRGCCVCCVCLFKQGFLKVLGCFFNGVWNSSLSKLLC